ncbi:GntR family transcriptional regulator [Streptomyces boluensis]|uniref:FCD domain-containing protein n=1 Tax=Streptomyces boluensis TaxID=1775135 RepID=A0A964XJK4_9ACTN|nr:GntR family transcriptional regulator [Streptomyces boluensis]NBE50136.1 FCD domain-containing protein [Streptomyces boluensis]
MSSAQGVSPRSGSAQDVTYDWLKRHIAQLPRRDGTFLTESGIATEAGTSRTPVREALLRLEAEGFVQIVPKKGAFVPPISDTEVQAVMQARALVEDFCIRQVVALEPEFAAELERLVDEQEALLDDPVAFIDCDRVFHRTIVQHAGNPVLADFYESLRDRQIRMGLRAVARTEHRARTVLAEHRAIIEAVRAGEAEGAGEAVAAHLSSTLAALNLPELPAYRVREAKA